jgi:hypothetical protein
MSDTEQPFAMPDAFAAFQRDVDGVSAPAYQAFRAAGAEMPEAAREAAVAACPGLRRYDEAIGRVFDEARATVVPDGAPPAVWLVYNMGLVVKTPRSLFAVDLAHRRGASFAPALDFALVTHNHADHWDPAFYEAMNGAGKTVVSNFLDNYAAVRAGRPGGYAPDAKTFELGDATVRATLSDHNRYLVDFTTAFEVSVGDWTLYHTGDSCDVGKLAPSRAPDLWVVHPRCGLDVADGVRAFHPRRVAIAHLCEMGHPPERWRWTLVDGLRAASLAESAGAKAVVPLWGDRLQ